MNEGHHKDPNIEAFEALRNLKRRNDQKFKTLNPIKEIALACLQQILQQGDGNLTSHLAASGKE